MYSSDVFSAGNEELLPHTGRIYEVPGQHRQIPGILSIVETDIPYRRNMFSGQVKLRFIKTVGTREKRNLL